MRIALLVPSLVALASVHAAGCRRDEDKGGAEPAATASAPAPIESGPPPASAPKPAPVEGGAALPPLHRTTREGLLELVDVTIAPSGRRNPQRFLEIVVRPDAPGKLNQGNPEIAEHAISRQRCLEGLRNVTIQTPEQREACGGRDNMVPIWQGKDPAKARTCIDVFEYPNRACELPMVWVPPTHAEELCELQGKRLCAQDEWILACAGDPTGKKRQKFAYGDEPDLEACNTNKSSKGSGCDAKSAKSAWKTCPTRSEPSGAFPRCRSRFGVFDQHGNVAEAMTRIEADGTRVSQLKGSAWFYVDVARLPGTKPTKDNYPDHCAHDPRWHVEPMREATHSNYHLGFRCCATIPQKRR